MTLAEALSCISDSGSIAARTPAPQHANVASYQMQGGRSALKLWFRPYGWPTSKRATLTQERSRLGVPKLVIGGTARDRDRRAQTVRAHW